MDFQAVDVHQSIGTWQGTRSHFSSYHRWFRKLRSCYLPDQLLSDMYCTYVGIQVISGSVPKQGRRWEDLPWPRSILASFPVDTSCCVPPQSLAGEHNKPKLSGAFAGLQVVITGLLPLNGTRRACLVHVSTGRNLNTACLHCLFIVLLFSP